MSVARTLATVVTLVRLVTLGMDNPNPEVKAIERRVLTRLDEDASLERRVFGEKKGVLFWEGSGEWSSVEGLKDGFCCGRLLLKIFPYISCFLPFVLGYLRCFSLGKHGKSVCGIFEILSTRIRWKSCLFWRRARS